MMTILPGLEAICFFDFSMRSCRVCLFLKGVWASISNQLIKLQCIWSLSSPLSEQNYQQMLLLPYPPYPPLTINIIPMHSLLESRRTAQGPESPVKLNNLSPDKYGKAAYLDLTYTPSKLADNLLYREVTTLRKIEQGNGKVRETEALNSVFMDRLEQLKQERDGIEASLTSQITMYKRLLQESEIRNETRIKEIQSSFKSEIRQLLEEKEEEAKYSQSEKELLENRIEELESIVNNLKEQLDHHGNEFEDLKNEKEKLDIKFENVTDKLAKAEKKMEKDAQEAKERQEELSRKLHSSEVQWKKDLNDAVSKKEKQIESIERLHRTELEKIQNKRASENLMKNQEIKDLTNAFESEGKRLNEIINMKERMVENLNKDLSREKQKLLELTRSYEKEINDLAHEKSRLLDEVDSLNHENSKLAYAINDIEVQFGREKSGMENCIRSLKEEVELNQVNYIREKDRNVFVSADLEKEISYLRSQNANLLSISSENELLSREVRNLRELLLESSGEMEKCKEEFLRMGREKELLLARVRELGGENEMLHKIKYEKEEEARGWKDSYYISRNRY